MKPEICYAQSSGVNIAYYVVGDGPVDIVGIPAFVSHGELQWETPGWQAAAERATRFSRFIWMDKRGTGLSDRGVGVPTIEDVMADAFAVMDHAGVQKAVLFGQSEGGPAAILAAATRPDRVDSLIVYGSYAKVCKADDYPIGIPVEVVDASKERIVSRWGTGVGLSAWAPSLAGSGDPEDRERWARYQRMSASPRDVRSVMEMYSTIDVRHLLPSVSVPTLVIHRRGDRMVPLELGRYVADHIPDAQFVVIEGSDHMLFTEEGDTAVLDEIEEFITGHRSAPELTRRLATVLFSDISGSTERAHQIGDATWRDLLARHDQALRRAMERFGGKEVKSTGDGFLAMFDGPTAAIRCAEAMRDAAGALGVSIKAGVHTGEVELVGDDIAGVAVHLAARIVDRAEPGEVLVSSTVPGLAVGSGISFADRGDHELRGFPDRWRLFAAST